MALTRARAIAGDPALVASGTEEIARIVRLKRDRGKVLADVLEMRGMVEEAKGGEGAWDLKQAPGGLVDIEFIAQALQLIHAAAHPEIVSTDTEGSLQAAVGAGVLDRAAADVLLPALHLQSDLMQILRLCVEGATSYRRKRPPLSLSASPRRRTCPISVRSTRTFGRPRRRCAPASGG